MKNPIKERHVLMVGVLVFMFTAFGIPDANAAVGDLWLDLNVGSKHTNASQYTYNGKTEDYNERNYGLGASYQFAENFEATAGFFKNSYSKNSTYAGIKIKTDYDLLGITISPGITVGGVTGYDDTEVNGGVVQPIVVPSITVEYSSVRAVVGYIPLKAVFADAGTDVITFQLGLKF